MKLDPHLVHDLLAFYESYCSIAYPAADKSTITEHMVRLIDDGLLTGTVLGPYSGTEWNYECIDEGWKFQKDGVVYFMFPLTPKGHAFLARTRNQQR